MSRTSGFECPLCGDRELQEVIGPDLVHILELRCSKCRYEWAVEVF